MLRIAPAASFENMQPVRRHISRGALQGTYLNLPSGEDFRTCAQKYPEASIVRRLVEALVEYNGKYFSDSNPSFRLTRTRESYPRLYDVSSPSNRGSSTSSSLTLEVADYLTGCVQKEISAANPLFLVVTNPSRIELSAFLGGFTADRTSLVPCIQLGGTPKSPPERGNYPQIPFSQVIFKR